MCEGHGLATLAALVFPLATAPELLAIRVRTDSSPMLPKSIGTLIDIPLRDVDLADAVAY
jgi:hypothetical protein